jgi:hypothetical protein
MLFLKNMKMVKKKFVQFFITGLHWNVYLSFPCVSFPCKCGLSFMVCVKLTLLTFFCKVVFPSLLLFYFSAATSETMDRIFTVFAISWSLEASRFYMCMKHIVLSFYVYYVCWGRGNILFLSSFASFRNSLILIFRSKKVVCCFVLCGT